jgi:hypothetical protein
LQSLVDRQRSPLADRLPLQIPPMQRRPVSQSESQRQLSPALTFEASPPAVFEWKFLHEAASAPGRRRHSVTFVNHDMNRPFNSFQTTRSIIGFANFARHVDIQSNSLIFLETWSDPRVPTASARSAYIFSPTEKILDFFGCLIILYLPVKKNLQTKFADFLGQVSDIMKNIMGNQGTVKRAFLQ